MNAVTVKETKRRRSPWSVACTCGYRIHARSEEHAQRAASIHWEAQHAPEELDGALDEWYDDRDEEWRELRELEVTP